MVNVCLLRSLSFSPVVALGIMDSKGRSSSSELQIKLPFAADVVLPIMTVLTRVELVCSVCCATLLATCVIV